MRIVLSMVFVWGLLACNTLEEKTLEGRWQSDEALTLASMALVKEHMPAEHAALFENGFFGQMIVERTAEKSRSYLSGDAAGKWSAYKIVQRHKDYVVVAQADDEGQERKTRIYVEGDLTYVIVSKYQFREYFKRID